jgi:hypothetical protein
MAAAGHGVGAHGHSYRLAGDTTRASPRDEIRTPKRLLGDVRNQAARRPALTSKRGQRLVPWQTSTTLVLCSQ